MIVVLHSYIILNLYCNNLQKSSLHMNKNCAIIILLHVNRIELDDITFLYSLLFLSSS